MPLLLMLWLAVLPKNTILIKGAVPSASDASTPVPEQGTVVAGRYRNAYFGLSYPIPAGWKEQPAGPPPSESGSYVLAQFGVERANVLVMAQDFFFSLLPLADAKGLMAMVRDGLEPPFRPEEGPQEVTIGGRAFHRFAYLAPRSGLHWRILSTDARCHALTFSFSGTDVAALDDAERALGGLSLAPRAPACVNGYADIVSKSDPVFTTHRFNTIPVRVIIGKDGRVKHAHLLSAYADQSDAILTALRTWRFKPYVQGGRAVEVETGIVFGAGRD